MISEVVVEHIQNKANLHDHVIRTVVWREHVDLGDVPKIVLRSQVGLK